MAPNYYRGLIVALLVVFSVKLAQSDNFSNELQGQRDLDLETRGYIHVCGNGPEFMYTSPSKAVDTDGPTTSAGRANFCSLATSISSGAAEPQSSGAVGTQSRY
ncbi:hypothetical protein Mapa_010905 [Marchantia paleacea]|nr:hypothetical protein Mapa_010905 [Marchantia paleacea]